MEDNKDRIFGSNEEILYRLCHECYYFQSTAGCQRWFEAGTAKNFMICIELEQSVMINLTVSVHVSSEIRWVNIIRMVTVPFTMHW